LRVHIYNDAALEVFGPEKLGGNACDAWAEAQDALDSEFAFVMTRDTPLFTEMRFVPVQREGRLVDAWWT
jgi:hypothetical protein